MSQLYDLYLPLLFSGSLKLNQINGVGLSNPLQAIVWGYVLHELCDFYMGHVTKIISEYRFDSTR